MSKRILSLALAVILVLAACISAASAEADEAGQSYYVYTDNGNDLNVRSAPGGDIIGALAYGEKVEVISFINDNWAVINYKGETAYVNRRFVIPVDPAELEKAFEEERESYNGDPLAEMDAEYASAVDVDDYKISVRPARVTSVVNMRWVPSETGRIIAQYKATEELVVLKELRYYLQVQDPDTGDVGYIHKKFAAK